VLCSGPGAGARVCPNRVDLCCDTAVDHHDRNGAIPLRLEEGDYEHGARVGTWTFALPASRRWERYEQGKVVARGTPAQPDSFAIDFCACKDGARSITIPGGHILFQVNAVGLDSCAVRVYDERYARAARYHMSRGMGWQSFATAPAESAFAPLTPWLRARDVIRIEETLDLRDRAGAHEKH
jgi:hypothetical protein